MPALTLPDIKTALKITGGASDAELTTIMGAVEEGLNTLAGVSDPVTYTETRAAVNGHLIVRQRPLLSITSVTGHQYGTVATAGLFFVAESSIIRTRFDAAALLDDWYTVVYQAGRATVPAAVKLAGAIIVQHQWHLRQGSSTQGRASQALDETSQVPGLAYAVPNRAIQVLREADLLRGPSVG